MFHACSIQFSELVRIPLRMGVVSSLSGCGPLSSPPYPSFISLPTPPSSPPPLPLPHLSPYPSLISPLPLPHPPPPPLPLSHLSPYPSLISPYPSLTSLPTPPSSPPLLGPDGLCFFSGLLFYSQKFHLLFFLPSPLFFNYSALIISMSESYTIQNSTIY